MSITEIRALLDEDESENPGWHLAALQATEARWKSGEEVPMDWSKAKAELRTRRD